ncbi:MAG: hypothetical protein K2O65_11255 [Lachnospiraceae bacterium]|nr:hypothetical protein [Lachnospiraceae bacterium]
MILNNLLARKHKLRVCALLLFTAGTIAACGTEPNQEIESAETIQAEHEGEKSPEPASDDFVEEQVIGDIEMNTGDKEEPTDGEVVITENSQTDELKNRFGDNCISEQTFEVELSEYSGKVWFVPYAPAEEGQELNIQLVQDGTILTQIQPYVPENLEGQQFAGLDAVSFFDINYDNYTDIVLIETYGNTTFAAVYYGFAAEMDEEYRYFVPQWSLSEALSSRANPVSIAGIRELLGAKKNGEFAGYKEAYAAIIKLWQVEDDSNLSGDLIYVDSDDIPELVIGDNGFWVSLYTYHDGRAYPLMDHWGYGVMGNVGYEYIPKENRIRNYNSDYAGAIRYTTYMSMNNQYSLKTVTQIVTYNFDDVNENGYPDDDEQGSIGYYSASYADGVQITYEQYSDYDAGEYEAVVGAISLEELMKKLAE